MVLLVGVVGVGTGLRAIFYRWWLTSIIQFESRYQTDPNWKREADLALLWFKEAQFARSQGLISSLPLWVRIWRYVFVGCVILELLLWWEFAEYLPRF